MLVFTRSGTSRRLRPCILFDLFVFLLFVANMKWTFAQDGLLNFNLVLGLASHHFFQISIACLVYESLEITAVNLIVFGVISTFISPFNLARLVDNNNRLFATRIYVFFLFDNRLFAIGLTVF